MITNNEKTKKKLTQRKGFRYSMLGAFAVILGVGAGFAGACAFKQPLVQHVANGDNYQVSAAYLKTALAKYNGAKEEGTSLKDALTPDEAVNLAYSFYEEAEYGKAIGVGLSDAGIAKQTIQSCSIKNGAEYFEESNSLGIVNIYNRMYEEGDSTKTYWGSDNNYAAHPEETMTNEDYAELMGRTVSDPLIYIVSPSTILEGATISGDKQTGIYENGNGYTIEIEMKFEDGVMPGIANYQKQMKTISGLKSYPVFEYCHLTVVTDADLNLMTMTTHERYQADMGFIKSKCTGSLTTHYSTAEVSIPSLSESIDYSAYEA